MKSRPSRIQTAAQRLTLAMGAPSLEAVLKAHATRKLARRIKWRGLDISIENDKGDTRKGVGPDGKAWSTTMTYPYSYIRGTTGADGDHEDAFLNEDGLESCSAVYVIHTLRPDGGYDEDKSMLGWPDEASAVAAFCQNYDHPEKHLGAVTPMSADAFVAYCKGGRENWDKPLVPRAKMKVQLAKLAHGRLEKAQQERRDWMRGVIETAKAELAQEKDEALPIAKAQDVTDGEQKRRDHIYSEFHRLCNMSGASVMAFAASEDGKKAGLSRGEAAKQGIASGRSRPKQIAHLKSIGKGSWTSGDYAIAGRIVNFISRMSGASGPLKDDKGQLTRRATSLKIWGRNPFTSASKAVELLEDDASEEVLKAAGVLDQAMSKAQMEIVANNEGKRLLRIVPSYDAMDLQGEFISSDVIKKYWPYYESNGNIDIEHLTKKGGDDFEETRAALYAQGFPAENQWGRIEWEVGKPVEGSFNEEDCSYLAEIYTGEDDTCAAANWFWRTVTEVSPPWVWKPSVAGRASRHTVVAEVEDPMLGIESRKQKVNVIDMFLWDNTALTRNPVNHWVEPVQIARSRAQKGFNMTDSSTPTLIPGVPIPDPEGKVASKEVVKAVMLMSAQSAIADMLEAGELEPSDAGELLGELSKALAVFGDDYVSPYVSKALDFGQLTTNTAELAGGYAATREGLSPFKKKKMARELYEDTKKGLTPFQKGFQFSDAPPVDVADFLVEEYDLGGEDALDVAETFLENLSAWAAGL